MRSVLAIVALALAAGACASGPRATSAGAPLAADSLAAPVDIDRAYTVGQFTRRPRMMNEEAIRRELEAVVSTLLNRFTVSSGMEVVLDVDRTGQVTNTAVHRTSGDTRVDQGVQQVLRGLRFRPGQVNGVDVSMRLGLPLTFGANFGFNIGTLQPVQPNRGVDSGRPPE